jgi:RNA-binding protein
MGLSSDKLKRLRGKAQDLSAHLKVGKSGLSEGFIEELESALARDDLVKMRMLRSARAGESVDEMAEELADRTDSHLVEIRGHTVVLYRG